MNMVKDMFFPVLSCFSNVTSAILTKCWHMFISKLRWVNFCDNMSGDKGYWKLNIAISSLLKHAVFFLQEMTQTSLSQLLHYQT